jgi:hypothetical protein
VRLHSSDKLAGILVATTALCGFGTAHAQTPTVSEFLNAANALYQINATPSGMTRFTSNGKQVTLTDDGNGAVAGVFVTAERQIIISFQGTTGGTNFLINPVAAASQLATDVQVVETDDDAGTPPAALTTSLSFAQSVVSMANAQGFTTSNIFVTGHSLGGIESEFVAIETGLGGIAFESTGLSDKPAPGVTGANFVNTVTFGDPVGNFGSDIEADQPTAPPFVPNGGLAPHFGNVVFLGTPSDQTTLQNELLGNPVSDLGSDIDFLSLLIEFHLPGVQAHDMDISLSPSTPIVDDVGDMNGEVLSGVANLQIPAFISAASAAGRLVKG